MQKPISMKDFAKSPQLVVLYPESQSDLYSEFCIQKLGFVRKTVATVPHTLAALYSLPNTNLICALSERAVKAVINNLPLAIQPLTSIKKCCVTEIKMVWHPKNRNDPAHTWLRDSIVKIAKQI